MKKKIIYAFIAASIFYSCSKSTEKVGPEKISEKETQGSKTDVAKIGSKIKIQGAGSSEGCEPCYTNPAPSQYTGYTETTLANAIIYGERYGLYSDPNYDLGWSEGHRDAEFWYNYYAGECGGISYKLRLKDKDTGEETIEWPGTSLYNKTIMGIVLVTECSDLSQYLAIRCQLTTNCAPKGLLTQYYYNTTYPGVSTAQHQYDLGRYYGFKTGTQQQPLGVAPTP